MKITQNHQETPLGHHVTLSTTDNPNTKDEDQMTNITMKEHQPDLLGNSTSFKIRDKPTRIFTLIKQTLDKNSTEYTVSPTAWKITYKKQR